MKEAFGRARFAQQLKKKGIDVNKMHSDNVKDAEAAKKRAASAQSDLDSFRKKTGVTSESKDEFEPHMMYDPKTGKGKMAKVEADHIRMKKMGYTHDKPDVKESVEDLTGHTRRRLATIIKNPSHPMHAAAKAEMDRRHMTRESFKTFIEATYSDTGWQKPKKDNMSAADGMKKAKSLANKGQSLAKVAASGRTVPTIKPVKETKGAPKGYHFTRDGKLKKGDAGADGDGGAKLRSDPLDKQRSKIPPLPEKFANPAQQAAVMAKLKKSGKYDGKESKLDELDKKTLGSYIKKAGPDAVKQTAQAKRHSDAGDMADKDRDMYKSYGKSQRAMDKAKNRQKGISKAVDKLTKEATIPDGQTVMTKKDPVKKNDMDKLAKIRKMLDREKKK